MSQKRSYRTLLSSKGLIFLGDEELELKINNLSLTGLLAELVPGERVKTIQDVDNVVESSAVVDIYLPELQLAGEAEVVRVEEQDGIIQLGLEFHNIVYEVDDLLYRRKVYRKNLVATGTIGINGRMESFEARNVSVDGMLIFLDQAFDVEKGLITIFDFAELGLRGTAKVVWCDIVNDDATLIGLEYVSMENDKAIDVPGFKMIDDVPD